jgi:hypothetical protein
LEHYEAPVIVVLGTVEELTEGQGGSNTDGKGGSTPFGPPG